MTVIDTVRGALTRFTSTRSDPAFSFNQWLQLMTYSGTTYPLVNQTMPGQKQEVPAATFEGYIQGIYRTNGVVFACMAARMLLFSEARFQFRRFDKGRPGEMFGTAALRPLETPWPNATTGDLLSRVIQDADLSGNHYSIRRGGKILRIRPDWMTIVVGSQSEPDDPGWALDAEVVGYLYQPGGYAGMGRRVPQVLMPEEVAHFAPIPDPAFKFRGMSWLQPVISEILGDAAATQHKLKFFENAATPNMAVSLDKSVTKEMFDAFVTKMKEQHEGVLNAYRTLYLGGGATASVVGANMRQIDFKATQGAGETRIAAAAGVPPVIVGLSEGLAASTYSNYSQARRRFADGTMRPLWRNLAGSFAHLVDVPSGAELWYDDRDISFLQEDQKDAADIMFVKAQASEALVRAGFVPDSIVKAIDAADLTLLKHSGLYSVQLQSPGTQKLPETVPGETPATPIAGPAPQPALPAPAAAVPVKRDDDGDESGDFTARERQIRDRLARGHTNKQMADELGIGVRTVESHVNSVMRKLGVTSRTQVTSAVVTT
jgi:DNA-binding NarL/FixJ family response regulator